MTPVFALLGLLASAASPAEPVLEQGRAIVEELERAADALEGKKPAGSSYCGGAFLPEALLRDLESAKLPWAIMEAIPALSDYLASWSACSEFSGARNGACGRLEPLDAWYSGARRGPWSYPAAYRCRRDALLWRFDRARITRSPDIRDACLQENAHRRPEDGGPFKPGTYRQACPIVADYFVNGGDPLAACGKLIDYYRYANDAKDCAGRILYAQGDQPENCPALLPPPFPQRCRDLAVYRKASDRRRPEDCGDSAYCRLLMGAGPRVCEGMARTIQESVCGRFSAPYARSLASAFASLLKEPEAAGKLAELRPRFDAVSARLGPEGPAGAPCPGGAPSPEAFLDRLKEHPTKHDWRRALAASEPLTRYFSCQAAAAPAGTDPCGRLSFLDRAGQAPGPFPWVYSCRRDATLWAFDRARLTRSDDFIEACEREGRGRLPADPGPFKERSLPQACRLLERSSIKEGDRRKLCAQLKPFLAEGDSEERCLKRLRLGWGEDPRLCEGIASPYAARRCRELVVYRKALEPGGACGGSSYCRMQVERTCEGFRDEAQAALCGRSAP